MEILIPSILLSVFGLFNLFGLSQDLFFKQLVFFLITFIVYFIIKSMGRNFFKLNSSFFYWLLIAILIVTYIIGLEVKGSKRWLDLYFFNFQASEFFKVVFVLFMANYFRGKKLLENNLSFFLKSFLYFIVPAFIIFKQPDLGNAAVFAFIYLVIIIFSDQPKRYLLYLFSMTGLLAPVGWLFLKGYQKARIASFLNPHLDIEGTSYNMIQAVITIGSGGFFGKGLGLGTQSRLYFLPENTTDFAFASLVEQFGFVGGFFVIFLYGLIIYALAKKIIKYYFQNDIENKIKFLYCLGILSYFVFQVVINIGMNMGLLPIAGIALPFISYGGSSVLALMIGFALLP
ncbi:MAG: Rod shape-determining protein RodA [Candidatus Roizmanbacteria bacterium GW2011_GWA2_35_19]|uniref:Rod shape-determining protein RodA n=1 Tax=Candidatus Roizmanbacteria bacterium GW2011_GWA2_35_19 TaxID=1618478 RepID=A0A0G0CCQ2_9BACT|nr:MAG: Rod shape-determining protein RodA [Candidatus Roizmanbacteria bacterium GW2011_GWA2_35_19]